MQYTLPTPETERRVFALLTDLIDKYIEKPNKKTKAEFLKYYNSVEPYLQWKWKNTITKTKGNKFTFDDLEKSMDLALALMYKEELKKQWTKQ